MDEEVLDRISKLLADLDPAVPLRAADLHALLLAVAQACKRYPDLCDDEEDPGGEDVDER